MQDIHKKWIYNGVGLLIIVLYVYFTSPPIHYPTNTIVTIQSGLTLSTISNRLYNAHIISSKVVFRSLVIVFGGEKKVIEGDYLLDRPETVFTLAYRLVRGNFHLNLVKITIPEGWNVFQINNYLNTHFVHFDTTKFLLLSQKEEGYLFPETYFISPVATPEKIMEIMRVSFNTQISKIPEIRAFDKPLRDIVTMASIVEAEARTTESRRIVAGILWKRLTLGMPLQVDSTFMYINGKNTYELTANDLKIDSPYNTYVYKGLPPGPIDNPGVGSLRATVTPTETDYLYFFSSRDGTMYYAKTFEEHKKNIQKYGK